MIDLVEGRLVGAPEVGVAGDVEHPLDTLHGTGDDGRICDGPRYGFDTGSRRFRRRDEIEDTDASAVALELLDQMPADEALPPGYQIDPRPLVLAVRSALRCFALMHRFSSDRKPDRRR